MAATTLIENSTGIYCHGSDTAVEPERVDETAGDGQWIATVRHGIRPPRSRRLHLGEIAPPDALTTNHYEPGRQRPVYPFQLAIARRGLLAENLRIGAIRPSRYHLGWASA